MSEIKRVLEFAMIPEHAGADSYPEKRRTERTTSMSAKEFSSQITTAFLGLQTYRMESR